MTFDVFLNFDGDCRAALEFYCGAFGQEMPANIMTYDQSPMPMGEENKGRIMYCVLPIFGCNVMLSDCAAGAPYVKGNNIALTLGSSDKTQIEKIYTILSEGGSVIMPLGQTFFSELYGMLTDKFGVIWQLSYDPPAG